MSDYLTSKLSTITNYVPSQSGSQMVNPLNLVSSFTQGNGININSAASNLTSFANLLGVKNAAPTITKAQAGYNTTNTLSNFIQRQGYTSLSDIASTTSSLASMAGLLGAKNATGVLQKASKLASLASVFSGSTAVKKLNSIGSSLYLQQTVVPSYYAPSVPNYKPTKFNNFISEIKNRGVSKQANYLIEIIPPPFLTPDATLANVIRLFCEQIMFPEMVLSTVIIKDAGLNREVVYDKGYGQVQATFLCDQDMVIKDFFDSWVSGIVKKKNGVFEYPNRYTSYAIRIHQLNEEKKIVYTVVLNRVFVKGIQDVLLNASSREASRIQVVFAYESWDAKRVKPTVDVYVDNQPDIGVQILRDFEQSGNLVQYSDANDTTNNPDDLIDFSELNPEWWI